MNLMTIFELQMHLDARVSSVRAATLNLKRGMAGDAPTGGKSFKQSWLSDKGVSIFLCVKLCTRYSYIAN